MADEPFYSPTAKPPPPRVPRPGERLFDHAHTICRVTLRNKLDPSFRYNDFGVRLARSL